MCQNLCPGDVWEMHAPGLRFSIFCFVHFMFLNIFIVMFFLHFFVCMFLLFRHVLFAHSHGIPFEQTSLFFIWDPKSFCLFSCSNVIPDPMKLLMLIFSYAPAELIPVSAKIHSFYESLCLASQRQRLLFSPRFDVFSS